MPSPPITLDEFAARIRGDSGFGSDAERAQSIEKSELIAAAGFDYLRTVGYCGISAAHHMRCCANYIAAQMNLPPRAVGMPVLLILLWYGPQIVAVVQMIWKAADWVSGWLSHDEGTGGAEPKLDM